MVRSCCWEGLLRSVHSEQSLPIRTSHEQYVTCHWIITPLKNYTVNHSFWKQSLNLIVFPISCFADAKVSVQCKDAKGKVIDYAQASTNFLGDFIVSFKGKEDLKGCSVYLAGSPDRNCNIVGGGGRTLSLKSKFLFKAMYVVDPLFYKPSKPMGFCPRKGPSPRPSRGGITIPFPNRRPSTCSCL